MFTLTTLTLTPALLHTLGEGVARLRDGDLANRAEADEVCNLLAAYGYRHTGYSFHKLTPADLAWDTVCEALRSYAPDPGEPDLRIPVADQEPILKLADGFGPGITDPTLLWDWSHVRDSSEPAILAMAAAVQTYRENHG